MLSNLFYKLYAIKRRRLRNFILNMIKKLEGGEMLSKTLRRIFRDYHDVEVGLYSYGGCFDSLRFNAFTKIGRYCSFAAGICRFNGNHPLSFRSMHPYFYNPYYHYVQDEKISRSQIVIGNDVWVGQNVLILPSVSRIGDGAVVGAGSVVTKDVPDFAVVVGNPAKVARYRFSPETIEKIKRDAWWDKDIDELKGNIDDFLRPVEEVLNEVQKN